MAMTGAAKGLLMGGRGPADGRGVGRDGMPLTATPMERRMNRRKRAQKAARKLRFLGDEHAAAPYTKEG